MLVKKIGDSMGRGKARDMMNTKQSIIEKVSMAKGELEKALEGRENLPAFDPHAFGFAAHALNNYLTVARAGLLGCCSWRTIYEVGLTRRLTPPSMDRKVPLMAGRTM